ncbi:hypothetical protein GIB67_000333 [Kingdonia uniflora]|uniref:Uncharacterized protein n=1 Tax=Kingdonia uniflora TaxID=39325 RepID=A0A7J7LCE2_9MAGN|nr:hypothetical protein GIB67_000333 [Kingdonia uniflora]
MTLRLIGLNPRKVSWSFERNLTRSNENMALGQNSSGHVNSLEQLSMSLERL